MSNRLRASLRTSLGPLLRWETGLALVVVVIGIAGASVSSEFFTGNNIFNLGLSYGEIAIMTLPMALIVISGEIDLSVASIAGMSSALLGYLWARGWPMIGIFGLIAVVGLAAGAVNGLLVTRLGLPSLAVTIGTLAVYRGIATILLGPNTVANFPTAYTNLGVNAVPFTGNDITYSTAIFIVLAIVFGIVLHATPFGRSVYAMGASTEAAQFAGIRVKRIKTVLFMTSGLVCALAGVLLTFRLNTAVQNNGLGLELDVVAIVLLGGVSIFGGKGSIVGVVLGVLAFAGIQNALFLTNFNQEAAGIVTGALLLLSVFGRNLGSFSSRLRAWRPEGRRGRDRIAPPGDRPRRRSHPSRGGAKRRPRPPRRESARFSEPKTERIQMKLRQTAGLAVPLVAVSILVTACTSSSSSSPGATYLLVLLVLVLVVLVRRRRAEDRHEGLRDPEEPREQLLHHRGQRELRRRDRRAPGARRDRDGNQRHRGHAGLADPGHPGRGQQGRERAHRLGHRPDGAVPDAERRDEARDHRRHLRLGRADLPEPVHQPGLDRRDRHQRGRRARQATERPATSRSCRPPPRPRTRTPGSAT